MYGQDESMKTVVVSIKRPGRYKGHEFLTKVFVNFDDNPFEFLDEPDKPQNAAAEEEQLKSLAQSLVAKKISDNDIDLTNENQKLRTHVLISGKKDGALQVDYTVSGGVQLLSTSSQEPNLNAELQKKFPTATFSDTYGEIGAEHTLGMPVIPENILTILQEKKKSAAKAKESRNLAKQKEEFLTKGPSKIPAPVALPASIITTAKKDINLKNAVEKLSTLKEDNGKLNEVHQKIETCEIEIKALDEQLTELKKREASLGEAMSKDERLVSFAQSHLKKLINELQQTKLSVEIQISTFRTKLSEAKKSFSKHVTDNYSQYETYENTLQFTKQVILTALYNAALDYYKKILNDTVGNVENRKKMIEEFNQRFAGIANIDDRGNVKPIEETYKNFAGASLSQVEAFTNELIEKCDLGITSPKFIETRLEEANKYCVEKYKALFNDLIYTDAAQKMPFIMEKSIPLPFGLRWLKKVNLNIGFEQSLSSAIQSASDPVKLACESSKIPEKDAIGAQQSALQTAATKLTNVDQKVKNFQRYIELNDKLEARKILASNQKRQIDKVTEYFNKVRDSIVDQIKDQPLEVQQYVLKNIKPQLAKSVFNQLSENNRMSLGNRFPWLAETSEASELQRLTKKYEALATEILIAEENLNKIKEEDIRVEQLEELGAALDKVGENVLEQRELQRVIEQSKSYENDDLFIQDYLVFQKQLTDAKEILAKQIQDAEKKFELLTQANPSEEQLETFNIVRQSLKEMSSSFDNTEYQRNKPEQNTEELQRLTNMATSMYERLLDEYKRIDERIKSEQEASIAQEQMIQTSQNLQKNGPPPSDKATPEEGTNQKNAQEQMSQPPQNLQGDDPNKVPPEGGTNQENAQEQMSQPPQNLQEDDPNKVPPEGLDLPQRPQKNDNSHSPTDDNMKKEVLPPSKPGPTIETKIREIYERYKQAVAEETKKLFSTDAHGWNKLFEAHKKGEEDNPDEFQQRYTQEATDQIQKDKAVISLEDIIKLIEGTEWKTGIGIGILKSRSQIEIDGKKTPVPNHIYKIYQQAKLGTGNPELAHVAMKEINNIATRAINHSASVAKALRKRDQQTQDAYNAIELHSRNL